MEPTIAPSFRNRQSKGQVFVLYALLFPVLFLFLGLGIDIALIYTSKARLSRAIDSTALRLTRKFENDQARRQNITVQYMKLNYPGFFSNGYSVETEGNVNNVETMQFRGLLGATDDYLKVVTRSEPDTGVVRVELSGRAKHRTFFMPLAGEGFREVRFTGNATADRFPALNVLVLDVSGSMRNGADVHMFNGIKAFVNEFVDDRDLFLVVTYSTFGKVVWPDRPITDGGETYYRPSRGFKGTNEALRPNASDVICDPTTTSEPSRKNSSDARGILETRVRMAGVTSAAEGMRVAFNNVDAFLKREPNRDLMKVNYIFFSDGDFNSFRGYVRGLGYGMSNTGTPQVPAMVANVGRPPGETLPAFHTIPPISASKMSAFGGQYVDRSGNPIILSNYTHLPANTYDLAARMAAFDPLTQPGVSAVLQGYNLRNAHWKDGNIPYSSINPTGGGPPAIRTGASGGDSYMPASNTWPNLLWTWNGSTWVQHPSASHDQVAREVNRLRRDHAIYYPESDPLSFQDKNRAFEEYYPGGRAYSNMEPTSATQGFYLERNSNSWGPTGAEPSNYSGWNYGVTRLSKYYNRYAFGAPLTGILNYPPSTSNNTSGFPLINDSTADWYQIGAPTHFWSYRDNAWVSARHNANTRITQEGNWLTEAQSMLARVQHNATIYTVLVNPEERAVIAGQIPVIRRMANNNNGNPFYQGQPQGNDYYTTKPAELSAVFRDIALKIAVRISE